MRVKVDEDLPGAIVHILRTKGYIADSVLEEMLNGYKDPELWREVQKEGRFLVTADKGFADIRQYPPGTHAGVLLLRPDEDGIRPVIELMVQVLANYHLSDLEEATTVVNPRSIRVRRMVKGHDLQ